jgi:hypothetical protein
MKIPMHNKKSILFFSIVLLLTALIIVSVVSLIDQPQNIPKTRESIVFDFDSGSLIINNQKTPFSQTVENVTATFSSPSDPGAFAIINNNNINQKLSSFSGNYLTDLKTSRDILDIQFNKQILEVKINFATIEQKSDTIQTPSDVLITVYNNTKLVGSNTAFGSFSADSYPQGTLSFFSGVPFNRIRLSMPTQPSGTTDFMVDKIVVSAVSNASPFFR